MPELKFPEGTLRMHAQGAINTSVSPAEAAQKAADYNTPDFLRHGILEGPDVLRNWHLDDGTGFSIIRPTGPYTPRAIMLSAYTTDYQELSRRTHFIYDLSAQAQREYWRLVINGLGALEDMTEDNPDMMVLYVENSLSTVTSPSHRTSRTLTPHHGHFIDLDRKLVIPEDNPMDHLEVERAFLRRDRMGGLVDQIGVAMRRTSDIPFDITRRMSAPVGYVFEIPGRNSNDVQEIMLAHHRAYSEVAGNYLEKIKTVPSLREPAERVIPLPSYRLYTYLDEGDFEAIIAPEVISHAGVMEAAGIKLERSEQHPKFFSDEDTAEFRQRFVDRLGIVSDRALVTQR